MRGTGYGLIADIAIGIVGALIGAWLLPRLGIHLGSGIVAAIISATVAHYSCCLSFALPTDEADGECRIGVRAKVSVAVCSASQPQ